MSNAKKKDYSSLFKKSESVEADKVEIEKLRKKLIEELKNPEKAKKAAQYIEHLINENK